MCWGSGYVGISFLLFFFEDDGVYRFVGFLVALFDFPWSLFKEGFKFVVVDVEVIVPGGFEVFVADSKSDASWSSVSGFVVFVVLGVGGVVGFGGFSGLSDDCGVFCGGFCEFVEAFDWLASEESEVVSEEEYGVVGGFWEGCDVVKVCCACSFCTPVICYLDGFW